MLSNILNWIFAKIKEDTVLRDELRNTIGIDGLLAREIVAKEDRNLILFVSNNLSDVEVEELRGSLEEMMPSSRFLIIQSDEPVVAIRV
jgi:hypothetical protein